jgi:cytochrome c553
MMRDRAALWVVAAVAALTLAALAIGFLWLPSAHADFTARGVWDMICRAAGVPASWSQGELARATLPTTRVVLLPPMARPGSPESAGRGASLALAQCTMCHGARGVSAADTPNLAGQYPDVIVKQLADYQRGDRRHALMQALAANLGERDMADLASYYASLPRESNVPITDMSTVPALVRVGDPMRNVAPCAACHGGIDRKLGAPWLEGMPLEYLRAQLAAFARGERRNDSHAQMRNMARALTAQELDAVAAFYARPGEHAANSASSAR